MRLLICGSSGNIGKEVVRQAIESNRFSEIVGISRIPKPNGIKQYGVDISDYNQVVNFFNYNKFDVVMHLACNPSNQASELGYDNSYRYKTNTLGTFNLLECCQQNTKFIYAGSVVVYGNRLFDGVKLHNILQNGHLKNSEMDICFPVSAYASGKLSAELLINAYQSMGKVKGVNLRLCATVGGNIQRGVVADIVKKLKSDAPTLNLLGESPGTIKPYSYLSDTASAFIHAVNYDYPVDLNTFNIVPNNELSIYEVANVVMNTLGIRKDIVWGGESSLWKGDNPVIRCRDNYKKVYLKHFNKYKSSEDAIRRAILDIGEG